MNLFLFSLISIDDNVKKYCLRHTVKMPLEIAQMLYTALHLSVIDKTKIPKDAYKKTHVNHPTSLWIRESPENWEYALRTAFALCAQYKRVYGDKRRKKDPKSHGEHGVYRHLIWLQNTGYHKSNTPVRYKSTTIRAPGPPGCTPFPLAIANKTLIVFDEIIDLTGDKTIVYKVPNAPKSYMNVRHAKNKDWTQKGRPMKFVYP